MKDSVHMIHFEAVSSSWSRQAGLCLLLLMCLLLPARSLAQNKATAAVRGFVENKGQIVNQEHQPNTAVKFLLSLPGINVQLKANSFSYDTYTTSIKEKQAEGPLVLQQRKTTEEVTYHFSRVDVEFIGANPRPQLISEAPAADVLRYFTNGTQTGIPEVRHFGKVTYKGLYPGIDLEFLAQPGTSKPVEYNFIVAPGADISQIKWRYAGAEKAALAGSKIEIQTANGTLSESIPLTYEKETRQPVALKYNYNNGIFSFEHPVYKKQHTLIIDPFPEIAWATYVGGNDRDQAIGVEVDDSDNVILTGKTITLSGFATSGAYQTVFAGAQDLFIMKKTPAGTITWTTYFGSYDTETLGEATKTLDLDANGNILIAGSTNSLSGLATSGAAQTVFGGGTYDGFIAKFTRNGMLEWCTYLGGEGQDESRAISADPNGNVIVVGYSTSTTGMVTPGAFQAASGGSFDAVLSKYSSTGTLLWSTYYGGPSDEYGLGCTADLNGNVYISFFTYSSGLATAGAHQTTLSALDDNIIAKFDPNGNRIWATYYGGPGQESITGLTTDNAGNLYFAGASTSLTDVATIGSNTGGQDAIIGKFTSAGVRLWARYMGGSTGAGPAHGSDGATSIALDPSGNIAVNGQTTSEEGLATPEAPQMRYGGGKLYIPVVGFSLIYYDTYVAKLTKDGDVLWSTYYGGSGYEWPMAIATNSKGHVLSCGYTTSLDAPTTPTSVQPSMLGTLDGYLVVHEDLKGSHNMAATRLVTPGATFCAGKQKLSVEISNRGNNRVDSVKIGWSVDGVVQTPVNHKTAINTWGKATIQLDSVPFVQNDKQDIKIWTYLPNGVTDTVPGNDTLHLQLQAGLKGTYALGSSSGSDYASFGEAVADLKKYGVCGPVVFEVEPGTYTERVDIGKIAGVSASNTVTFKGLNRSSVVLTSTNANADTGTVTLDKAQYVIFRNMTISSNSTAIKINDGSLSNSFIALDVFADSAVAGFNAITVGIGDLQLFDSLLVAGGYNGIVLTGDTSTYSVYTRILNSVFTGQSLSAISASYQNLLTIRNNAVPEYNLAGTGVNMLGCANFEVTGNRFYGKGLELNQINKKNWSAGFRTRIVNNMISAPGNAITLYDVLNISIYHNSLLSTDLGTAVVDISLNNGGIDLRNNQVVDQSGGTRLVKSNGSVFNYMNSNNYHPQASGFDIDGTVYSTLSSLKAAFPSLNTISYDTDPLFAATNNLYTAVYLQGEPVNIQTDIDGLYRCMNVPYVGANEKDRSFPKPVVSSTQTSFFKGLLSEFQNSIGGISNKDLDFDWYINNVKVSDSINLKHTFADTGTYVVKLKARNCAASDSGQMVVYVINGRPVITLLGDTLDSIRVFSSYTDAGATAKDGAGTDISGSIQVRSNLDTANTGHYVIWYVITDPASGSKDSVYRRVVVYDDILPSISRIGPDTITIEVFSSYSEPGADITDNYCINPTLHISGSVDTANVGIYELTYTAEDCDGNFSSSFKRVVKVVDTKAPLIKLIGSDTVTLIRWQGYTDAGYSLSDNYYAPASIDVDTLGNWVNSSTVGEYFIQYKATDGSGNMASTQKRVIRVIDTTSTTGIEDFRFSKGIRLYPNPNNGQFSIELESPGTETIHVEVTDAAGRSVFQLETGEALIRPDLSHLAQGLYQVSVQQGLNRETFKISIIK